MNTTIVDKPKKRRLTTSQMVRSLRVIEGFKPDAAREKWTLRTWHDRCRIELGDDAPTVKQVHKLVKEVGGAVARGYGQKNVVGNANSYRLRLVARQTVALAREVEKVCEALGLPFNVGGAFDRDSLVKVANGRAAASAAEAALKEGGG